MFVRLLSYSLVLLLLSSCAPGPKVKKKTQISWPINPKYRLLVDPDGVIARVNGVDILRSELDKSVEVRAFYQQHKPEMSEVVYEKYAPSTFQDIVEKELVYQEAQKYQVKDLERLVKIKYKEIAASYPSPEEFKKKLDDNKMTTEKLEERIRNGIRRDYFIKENLDRKKFKVSEEEAKAYFEKNSDKFMVEEKVHLREMFFPFYDFSKIKHDAKLRPATEEEKKITAKKAGEIYEKAVEKGADFSALVKEYSKASNAPSGGDLGFIAKSELQPDIAGKIFKLKKNEISKPLETTIGYHIFQQIDKQDSVRMPFDKVRSRIKKHLSSVKQNEAVDKLVARLVEKAVIEVLVPPETDDKK